MTIKILRKKKQMSQADLGAAVGVKQSTVAMWESGRNKPRVSLLPTIAATLDITVGELVQIISKEAS